MSKKAIKQDEPLPRLQADSYTPGPWRILKNPNIGDAIESIPANITIVGMPLNDADGRLIAAAPDLIEALKTLLAASELGKYDTEDLRTIAVAQGKAQNAIEKAIGV